MFPVSLTRGHVVGARVPSDLPVLLAAVRGTDVPLYTDNGAGTE